MSNLRLQQAREERTDWKRRTRDGNGRFAAGDVTDPQARFDEKVDKTGECWLWQGSQNKDTGYGQFWLGGRVTTAHRASYILANGEIACDLVVDHKCHTPRCVRPSHLQAVTNQQNIENRRGASSNSKSGVRGVHWDKRDKRWIVQVQVHGKNHYGGRFHTLEEAARDVIRLRNELCTNNLADRAVSA